MAATGTWTGREETTGAGRSDELHPPRVVREVCLIGRPARRERSERPWVRGSSVEWSGRVYRVAAVQPPEREATAPGRRLGYVHLHLPGSDPTLDSAADDR